MSFEWNNHPLDVSASVGIAQLTSHTESIDEVMTGIEMATKEAKEKGRNRMHLFDDPELVHRRDQLAWVSRIQDALREDRFELHAQPIAQYCCACKTIRDRSFRPECFCPPRSVIS